MNIGETHSASEKTMAICTVCSKATLWKMGGKNGRAEGEWQERLWNVISWPRHNHSSPEFTELQVPAWVLTTPGQSTVMCMGLHNPWPVNSQAWRKRRSQGPYPSQLNSLLLGDSGRGELLYSFVTCWWPHQTPVASSNPVVSLVAMVKVNESHNWKSVKDPGNVWERA